VKYGRWDRHVAGTTMVGATWKQELEEREAEASALTEQEEESLSQ
jgi:hypothetical protein